MKRLQMFLVIVGLVLWWTGCQQLQQGAPKQQATNAATTSTDKQVQYAERLKQAEQQIQNLTDELKVTYMELEQEQTKVDVLLDENQNLNDQLQAVTERLLAAESKSNEPEKAPRTP